MSLDVLYDFAADARRAAILQEASLADADHGLSRLPALVGSPEWWRALEEGVLPRHVEEGTIARVTWGSMGDWPEFELATPGGARSQWTREGDVSRYVEGLLARVTFTRHPWKRLQGPLGAHHTLVLLVEIEPSERRSDPWAPGVRRVKPGLRPR